MAPAEADDADGRGESEVVKGDARGCFRAIGFHSIGDQDEVEEPLDTILVRRLPDAFFDYHIVSSDVI